MPKLMIFLKLRYRRIALGVLAFIWVFMGVCYYNLSGRTDRMWPTAVAVAFWIAGAATAMFVKNPDSKFWFLVSGGLGVCALASSALSYFVILVTVGSNEDTFFRAAALLINQVFVITLFWWFWLKQVQVWNVYLAERTRLAKEA